MLCYAQRAQLAHCMNTHHHRISFAYFHGMAALDFHFYCYGTCNPLIWTRASERVYTFHSWQSLAFIAQQLRCTTTFDESFLSMLGIACQQISNTAQCFERTDNSQTKWRFNCDFSFFLFPSTLCMKHLKHCVLLKGQLHHCHVRYAV